jgi:hypothetical protein
MAGDGVVAQVALGAGVEGALVRCGQPVGVERKVTPIRGERIGGEAVFDPERVDEAVDRALAGGARGGGA